MTQLLGIIGSPIAHSLSPLMHNTGYATLGLDAVMLAWDIPHGAAQDFVRAFRLLGMTGCAVTLPHKQDVMPALDGLTPRAEAVGAVNTLFWQDGALWGDNTDVLGFMEPLQRRGMDPAARILILGAGGAARAACAGLREAGCTNIFVSTRSDVRSRQLADEFHLTALDWAKRDTCEPALIINTTPQGMHGALEGQTPWDAAWFRGQGAAYDMIYTPRQTRFLADAAAAGWECISGLDMFLGQGAAQFLRWTGQQMPPQSADAVRTALYG